MKLFSSTCLTRMAAVVASASIVAFAGAAQAATVFQTDFNSIVIPADPGYVDLTADSPAPFSTLVNEGGIRRVEFDSADRFGAGTNNKILHHVDNNLLNGNTSNTNPGLRASVNLPQNVGFEVTFDFYDPSGSGNGTSATRLYLSSDITGNRSMDIALNNGAFGYVLESGAIAGNTKPYDQNTKYSVRIVGNYGPNDLVYDGGTVAQGTFHVWLGTTQIFGGLTAAAPFRHSGVTQTSDFTIAGTGNSNTSAAYFDNIKITVVPEPHSFLLLGLGVVGLFWAKRQK